MARSILQPRDGVMFVGVPANVIQKSTAPTNYGKPLEFSSYNCIAFQVWWAGINGPGTFQLQTTLKSDPVETDWVNKVGASIEVVAGTGTDIKVIANIGEKSVRMVWLPGAVTAGTVSSELMAKDSSGPGNFTEDNPLNVTASFSGLRVGGKVTEVLLNSATWTQIPLTPKAGRNAVALQNVSGIEVKINYVVTTAANIDTDIPGYIGMVIADLSERQYDIKETVLIFAKSQSGTPKLNVEELA